MPRHHILAHALTATLSLLAARTLAAQAPAPKLAPRPALDLKRAAIVADSAARAAIAGGQIPGYAIAIARDGETVFSRSYGRANVALDVPATARTVWPYRSITKQYTAAIVMRLAEQGKLRLDDTITTHLPDFPTQGKVVTIRHLLTHTSGLQTRSSSASKEQLLAGGEGGWHKLDLSHDEMVARWGKLPFEFEPGTKYDYNNWGYYLLGSIVGRVTGKPYAKYVEEDFLRPLGLAQTWWCDDHRIIPGRANGYEFYDGQLHNSPYVATPSMGGAAGALCGTLGDLVQWNHLLHTGKVVSPASLAQMTTRARLAGGDSAWYGFGFYLPPGRVMPGHRKVFHGGTRPGFGAYLSYYPDDRLTIAITGNGGTAREKADEIERAIASAAFGLAPKLVPLAATELPRYTGTYALTMGTRTLEVRVFADSGQLKAHPAGQRVIRLVHEGRHGFVAAEDPDIRLTFTMGAARADGVTLRQRGQEIAGTRKAEGGA